MSKYLVLHCKDKNFLFIPCNFSAKNDVTILLQTRTAAMPKRLIVDNYETVGALSRYVFCGEKSAFQRKKCPFDMRNVNVKIVKDHV